jgi:hypothetical protein
MYRWRTRADGVVLVQMTPGDVEKPLLLAPELVEGTGRIAGMLSVIERWEPLATKVADTFGLPVGWILAMIWRESGGNPRAFRKEPNGWTGIGLLQLTHPGVKAGLTDAALYDPETNLLSGARHILRLVARYGWDFPMVSAAYNAGSVRASTENPWGMVQTGGHVSAEVSALNYYLLRGERLAAERAAAVQFSTAELLGEGFDRPAMAPDIGDEVTPVEVPRKG